MSAPPGRMHPDEIETDAGLVRRLLAAQQPQWAGLPIERVPSSGTDNAIYRLGSELAARLPRRPGARAQVHKECEWLPRLAPHLPLALPVPLAKGEPGEGYPSHWSVVRWLDGENPPPDRLADPQGAAVALARFVAALQRVDTAGGPRPGAHNFYRGVPLALRDEYTRKALAALHGDLDVRGATAAWDEALAAPAWPAAPVWIHGDLTWVNVLESGGRISGVVDFGALGVGDPACDLIVAWNMLAADTRATFRAELGVDDATWERGRGWALSTALIEIPYYRETNPAIVARARRTIGEVLGRV